MIKLHTYNLHTKETSTKLLDIKDPILQENGPFVDLEDYLEFFIAPWEGKWSTSAVYFACCELFTKNGWEKVFWDGKVSYGRRRLRDPILLRNVREQNTIWMHYLNSKGEASFRIVNLQEGYGSRIIGHCNLKNEQRVF